MKLFFSPGACALHPQIALREADLPFELVRVDMRSHRTESGSDFFAVNPKGYVPVLELDDGSRLTEGAVISQFIADRRPAAKLAPVPGTLERYHLQEWLNFIASEVHKSFSPLFSPQMPEEAKEQFRLRIAKRFDFVAHELEGRPHLLGPGFTIADGYLFNMLQWTGRTGIDLGRWPALKAFQARIAERPAVQAALAAESGKHGAERGNPAGAREAGPTPPGAPRHES